MLVSKWREHGISVCLVCVGEKWNSVKEQKEWHDCLNMKLRFFNYVNALLCDFFAVLFFLFVAPQEEVRSFLDKKHLNGVSGRHLTPLFSHIFKPDQEVIIPGI